MAPPIPVYTNTEIRTRYKAQLNNPEKYNCELRSLVQHECTFKTFPNDRSKPPEIICLPFKRIFQRCLIPQITKENGKKIHINKWVNIEITSSETNKLKVDQSTSKFDINVQEFLNAEKDFRKLMEMEMEENA
ncbi:mitochondrial export protein Som1-domain-containing protein [Scheffersomyces amazonensis]|uniref:mitochondrial export protein Som1-domain-containing protein n=1 Tax=Scheffersomyces amazonensis TaxID=1078765 RepID=UPI00315CE51A